MFEYFENMYPWNLATIMVLNSGGQIDEVHEALSSVRGSGFSDVNSANAAFVSAWRGAAEKVESLAQDDERNGNFRAAGGKYSRAANYYFAAERQAPARSPERMALYQRMLQAFAKYAELRREPCQRVEIPLGDEASVPALFVPGKGDASKKPCMIQFDGLDVLKEWIYFTGIAQELSERGVSTLIVDHPGVGEALRLRGLTRVVEIERAASACVDWLETQENVDADRIGMMALSLGGYYSMRSVAFEPRFRCGVAWGAMYDFGAACRSVVADGSHRSVHNFLEHLRWVTGTDSDDDAMAVAAQMTLNGLLDRIKCPILIVHGENDRQVPPQAAERTFSEAVNSVGKELKIHKIAEGGCEHCSVDNLGITVDYMAHWIARTLAAPRELA